MFVVCYTSKLVADIHTLFYYRKMCECTQISYEKCDKIGEYSYEKNVNDVDFGANMFVNMCMKVW